MKLNDLPSLLSEALFPRSCVVCGGAVPAGLGWPLCDACEASLQPISGTRCIRCGKSLISERELCMRCRCSVYDFDSAFPLFRYAGNVKKLLVAYKAGGRRSLSRLMARYLADGLRTTYPGAVVVPVPPRPGKLRRKGWDQVEDLARALELRHGVAVARLLGRRGSAIEQKNLDFAGRAANMQGAFAVKAPLDPSLRYVLLDDVLTTGATLSECARVLKASGATLVAAMVFAAD
ncbi:MAG: ComF family protein [Spirochaetales bacterium]|nr:MAG: ComF family protein [Spirochaetales bacterium]